MSDTPSPGALPREIETLLDHLEGAVMTYADVSADGRSAIKEQNAIAVARAALDEVIGRYVEDGKRLDYLQDESCNVEAVMEMDPESEVGFIVRPYNDNDMPGGTLRDAIDACRFGEHTEVDLPREFPPRAAARSTPRPPSR